MRGFKAKIIRKTYSVKHVRHAPLDREERRMFPAAMVASALRDWVDGSSEHPAATAGDTGSPVNDPAKRASNPDA